MKIKIERIEQIYNFQKEADYHKKRWIEGKAGADIDQGLALGNLEASKKEYDEILAKLAKMDPAISKANSELQAQKEAVRDAAKNLKYANSAVKQLSSDAETTKAMDFSVRGFSAASVLDYVQQQKNTGITFGHVTAEDFWVTMNMMYSDYSPVAEKFNVSKPEFYAEMAKAFLFDKDGPDPREKLAAYYDGIVCAE